MVRRADASGRRNECLDDCRHGCGRSINYYLRGDIQPPLAAAAVLGVLAGSRVGFEISHRTNARGLKALMAGVLFAVAGIYIVVGR